MAVDVKTAKWVQVVNEESNKEMEMLILTRRIGETAMIGDDIAVTVLGVKGNQVRVGINAPKEVSVHREEIYERIKRQEEHSHPHANNPQERPRSRFA